MEKGGVAGRFDSPPPKYTKGKADEGREGRNKEIHVALSPWTACCGEASVCFKFINSVLQIRKWVSFISPDSISPVLHSP